MNVIDNYFQMWIFRYILDYLNICIIQKNKFKCLCYFNSLYMGVYLYIVEID